MNRSQHLTIHCEQSLLLVRTKQPGGTTQVISPTKQDEYGMSHRPMQIIPMGS